MSKESYVKQNDFLVMWKQTHGEWIPNFVDGKIYSTKTDAYLKPRMSSHGYYVLDVRLMSGARKTIYLHRALWVMRHGIPYDPKLEVDHINHNPLDNRLCNLRLVTTSENARNRPEAFARAEAIRCEKANGAKTSELAKKYGYSPGMIRNIVRHARYDPAKYPGLSVRKQLHWNTSGDEMLRWKP